MSAFTAGANVYLLDGREVEYVAAAGSKHLVAALYETDLGQWRGQEFVADAVFAEPPIAKLHTEVAELEQKIASLRQQSWDAQAEANSAEKANAERLKKLANVAPLARIEDFIEGRITHCVLTQQYGLSVEVLSLADTLKGKERERDLKLVCLHGKHDGRIAWSVNRYYDGSGGWTEIEPFLSEADAIARATSLLVERAVAASQKDHVDSYTRDSLEKSASAIGVSLPDEFVAAALKSRRVEAENYVVKLRADLERAEEHLASLGSAHA